MIAFRVGTVVTSQVPFSEGLVDPVAGNGVRPLVVSIFRDCL